MFFTISAVTDVLDGFIARKFDLVTNIGKLLDPLADKLTQLTVLYALVSSGAIPFWILIIVFMKEVIMIVGASFLYGKDVVVYSKWYGKLSTCLFYLAIVVSLVLKQLNITSGLWYNINIAIYGAALICTLFSLIMYVKCLYQGGFINKSDLKKDTQSVIVKDKLPWKKD